MVRTRSNSNPSLDRTGISARNVLNPGSSTRLTRQRSLPSLSSSSKTSNDAQQTPQSLSRPRASPAQSISAEISVDNVIGPLDEPRLTRQRSTVYVSAIRTTSTRQHLRHNPATQVERMAWKKKGSRVTRKRACFGIYVDPDTDTPESLELDSSDSDSSASSPSGKENVAPANSHVQINNSTAPSLESEESIADGATPGSNTAIPLAPSRIPFGELPLPPPPSPKETPQSGSRTPPPAPRARARARLSPTPPRRFIKQESDENQAALSDLRRLSDSTDRMWRCGRPTVRFDMVRRRLPSVESDDYASLDESEVSLPLPESADLPSLVVQPPSNGNSPSSSRGISSTSSADPYGKQREHMFQGRNTDDLQVRNDRLGKYRYDGTAIRSFKRIKEEREKEERERERLAKQKDETAVSSAVESRAEEKSQSGDSDPEERPMRPKLNKRTIWDRLKGIRNKPWVPGVNGEKPNQ